MKAVLISIQPERCEKIANGEKTIEVRKSRPKLQTPFKCYIYCTIGNGVKGDYLVPSGIQCGKVIGEFVCDRIDEYGANCYGWYRYSMEEACLWADEIAGYGQGKPLYGWHISQLKIYDKPKELSEFKRWNRTEENSPCTNTKWIYPDCKDCKACNLTRPPQSYTLVEEK